MAGVPTGKKVIEIITDLPFNFRVKKGQKAVNFKKHSSIKVPQNFGRWR